MISHRPLAGVLFTAAFLALMSASDGKAQTSNSSSNANSESTSTSGSTSGAAAISGNNRTNTRTNVTLDNRQFAAPTPTATSSDVTIRTAPQVYAPPVSGGNPCTLAVSGGVSVIGWGASAGGTFVDKDCADRQKVALIHNAGYKEAAKELMCNDKASYDAFKSAGQPCAYRAAYEGGLPPAPPARPAPYVEAAPSPAVMNIPTQAPQVYPRCSASITDNCQSGR